MLIAVSESALMASANISLDPAAVPFVSVVNAILIFVVYDLIVKNCSRSGGLYRMVVCREMFLVLVYLIAL